MEAEEGQPPVVDMSTLNQHLNALLAIAVTSLHCRVNGLDYAYNADSVLVLCMPTLLRSLAALGYDVAETRAQADASFLTATLSPNVLEFGGISQQDMAAAVAILESLAGEHVERRSWNDLDAKTQTSLLALMPKDVRARVRRGDMPSEDEVEELVRRHYDLGVLMMLWLVDETSGERELCRQTVKDSFAAARHSLERELGPRVRTWTDLQIMTMNVPAPSGKRWQLETRRVAPKTN